MQRHRETITAAVLRASAAALLAAEPPWSRWRLIPTPPHERQMFRCETCGAETDLPTRECRRRGRSRPTCRHHF